MKQWICLAELTNSHPLALLKIKTKFKTNHTARILISEIFLNKLSIGQLAQLSLIISSGLSFLKDVGLLRLAASLPLVWGQVRLTVYPSSPNHAVPFHRTAPWDWLELIVLVSHVDGPCKFLPLGFVVNFLNWDPPLLAPANKGEKGGLVSQGAMAQTWGQGLDMLLPPPHPSGERENSGAQLI